MPVKTAKVLNYTFFIAQILIAIGYINRKQLLFVSVPAITAILYIGIIIIEKFSFFRLNNYTRALLIIAMTGHNLLGEYYNFYTNVHYFDKFLHMFGTFSFALAAFELVRYFIRINTSRPAIFTFIIVLLLGISLGTIFELLEFALDVATRGRNQGGLIDTDMDMFYNLIGSALAGLFQVRKIKYLPSRKS